MDSATQSADRGGDSGDPSSVESIAELVRCLCGSASQVLMYAPEHPAARKSIQRTADCLADILRRKGQPISIRAADGELLFEGLPVEDRNPLVRRLADLLEEAHCHDLRFQPGLRFEEVVAFHEILARGADSILAGGGLRVLLKQQRIRHIQARESRYVLIGEDEKVVSARTQVVPEGAADSPVENDIAHYLSCTVLNKMRDNSWLLHELKDSPHRTAEHVVEGIEIAVEKAKTGKDPNGDGLELLLRNIEALGHHFTQEDRNEKGTVAFREAMGSIERELRARSGQLRSSVVSRNFVDQIMGVISGLSRGEGGPEATSQYLAGEHRLRATERLLRDPAAHANPHHGAPAPHAAPTQAAGPETAVRPLSSETTAVRPPEDNVFDLTESDDSLAQAIEEALPPDTNAEQDKREAPPPEPQRPDEREEFVRQIHHLEVQAARRLVALNAVADGIILWDEDGQIELVNERARELLGMSEDYRFRQSFVDAFRFSPVPLECVPAALRHKKPTTDEEVKIFELLHRTVLSANGRALGIILRPPEP